MTDDQEIEALRTAPIVVPLTRWERFRVIWARVWRIAQPICAVISVISLGTAAVGIVLVIQLAICTNTNLGQRSAPSALDAKAHVAFAEAVDDLFMPTTLTPEQQKTRIKKQVQTYVNQLIADQDTRNAHPLGKC